MSLINQMLQDLEKRRASGAERGALPDQVRVLPREELHGMPWWLIGIAVAVVVIALLAWQFNTRSQSASSALVEQAQKDMQSPRTPVMQGGPASRLALDLERAPPAAARTPARSGTAVSDTAPRRNLAPAPLTTTTVVASEPAVTPQSAPAVAESAKSAKSATENSKPASIAPVAVTAVPARSAITASRTIEVLPETKGQAAMGNPQIDKRPQTLTPQQLAENEYREAVNFLNQGRLADAQEGFRRALERNPAHIGARQGLFGLLLDAKKSAEAEQLLQDGLKLNPNQPGFAMALASLQYERGDIAGAIETMQRSAPAAQSSPDYLARLAGLLQRQSRHKEAIDSYQAALRLAPGSGVWQMGLGISLQALNRNSEAQEAFRRARSSNTLNPELQAFVDQRLKQLQ